MSSETKEQRQAEAIGAVPTSDERGWMLSTPPREEIMRRLKAKDGPITSRRIAILEHSHYLPPAECESSARRLAAAWNATRMLSVEQLESGAVAKLVEAARDMANGYAAVAERLWRGCMNGEDMQSFLARGSMSEMAMAVQALRSALSPFQQGGE